MCEEIRPDNAAYIIFTSGSTGAPKGVVLEHSTLSTVLSAHGSKLNIGPKTRVGQFSAYTFDVSIGDIFITLLHGGCVCVISDEDRLNKLPYALNNAGVNFMFLTSTVATLIEPKDFPSLETMVLVGEAVRPEIIETWGQKVDVISAYGPSECSIHATFSEPIKDKQDAGNIGVAFCAGLWVVDSNTIDRLCPTGVIGELLIDGPSLARGYLNKPELTASSFIKNPSWAQKHGMALNRRMYRTGDLVRRNHDGTLTFVGRRDAQIKIRGQRVELGEIEYWVKKSLASINRVVVDFIFVSGQDRDPVVIAAMDMDCSNQSSNTPSPIRLTESMTKSYLELQNSLFEALPSYMVPSIYIPFSHIPLTSSGKVDRVSLRELLHNLSDGEISHFSLVEKGYLKPSTETEIRLQDAWAITLRIDANKISTTDHFFRSGGDSVSAMRLVALLQKNHMHLSVADIFLHPRLSDMAHHINQQGQGERAREIAPFELFRTESKNPNLEESKHASLPMLNELAAKCNVSIDEIEDVYPCTPLQEGLLVLSAQDPKQYISQRVFRLTEAMDFQKFQDAWSHLFGLVPILRTRIIEGQQVVLRHSIEWQYASDLRRYLSNDKERSMLPGMALSRYAMVKEQASVGKSQYFVWTAHHSVYDGWSVNLIFEALYAIYQGNDIPDIVPYTRFLKYIQEIDTESMKSYWRSQFSHWTSNQFPPLPDHDYIPQPSNICQREIEVTASTKPATASIAIMLRAAWALVVSQHQGNADVLLGVPLSGRSVPVQGILDIIAPTITTVPVRIKLDYSESVGDYLAKVRQQAVEMMPFEHTGLQQIQRVVKTETGVAPEFQHLLVVQPKSEIGENPASRFSCLEEVVTDNIGFEGYALTVECITDMDKGVVQVEARFDDSIIPRIKVDKLLEQFELVFEQLIRHSERNENTRLRELDMLGSDDIQSILQWNRNETPAIQATVHELVSDMSRDQPNAPAICAWDGNFTYGEVEGLTDRLAHYLVSMGVKPEMMIPICFDKSSWALISMLAVIKAGGAIVPIGVQHPIQRVRSILQDIGAHMMLVGKNYGDRFQGLVQTFTVDGALFDQLPSIRGPLSCVQPHNAAVVIFTSGSTGVPKGVVLEHQALCTGFQAHGTRFGIGRHTRTLQFAAYTFDVSIGDIFMTWQFGGCICVISEEQRLNHLSGAIAAHKANFAVLTPTVAALLEPSKIPLLKTLVLGGEAPHLDVVEKWGNSARLINAYGPAECSINSTSQELVDLHDIRNIGTAFTGNLWVVDSIDCNGLVPIGVIGELLIEGPLLARGYVQKEKTDAAFITDPEWMRRYNLRSNRRMYCTGDLVYQNPDGTLVYVGRKDTQVKLRGQRLELAEIEHHLLKHHQVANGVITYAQSGSYKSRLVCTLVLHKFSCDTLEKNEIREIRPEDKREAAIQCSEISHYLSQLLTSYMIPTAWVALSTMPVNDSGKIDRRKINLWIDGLTEDSSIITAREDESFIYMPSTVFEEKLQTAWSQVLNIPLHQVPLNTSFVSIGGDSITAMQVVSRCRDNGIAISVRDILQRKSIQELSSIATEAITSITYTPENPNEPFPLSPMQQFYFQSMAAADMDVTGDNRYNQSLSVTLLRHVESTKIQQAIDSIVIKHPMLRARFHKDVSRGWAQTIHASAHESYRFRFHDNVTMSEVSNTKTVSHGSLNLENGPLFSVDLFHIPEANGIRQLLFLCAHHLVIDFVSWRIVMKDLEEFAQGRMISLKSPASFRQWSQHQSKQLQTSFRLPDFEVNHSVFWDYWGLNATDNTQKNVISERIVLPESLTSMLFSDRYNRVMRTEPVELFLAALLHSFHVAFPSRSLPEIFDESHGRNTLEADIDLSDTVGWFTTLVPLRVTGSSNSAMDILKRTKDARRSSMQRTHRYMLAKYSASKHTAHGTLDVMEIVFNYAGRSQQLETAGRLFNLDSQSPMDEISPIGDNVRRPFIFEIISSVFNSELTFMFHFHHEIHHQDAIREWISGYRTSIQQLVEELAKADRDIYTISDFPLADMSYEMLDKLQSFSLSEIEGNNIEDVYPCSPIQQGILISQAKSPGTYQIRHSCEVRSPDPSLPIDMQQLVKAWQVVINRHPILRTIFIESQVRAGCFDQLVLKSWIPRIETGLLSDEETPQSHIDEVPRWEYETGKPCHRLMVFSTTDTRLHILFEISHALVDASSVDLILSDLFKAYQGKLPSHPGPSYSTYIAYLQNSESEEDLKYWHQRLENIEPCEFPSLAANMTQQSEDGISSVNTDLDEFQALADFASTHGITAANVLQLAWAVVLSMYTGSEKVVFGYLASGRDAPIKNVSEMVGPMINIMVTTLDIDRQATILGTLCEIQNAAIEGLHHQRTSLIDIHHALKLKDRKLFNTTVSYKYDNGSRDSSFIIASEIAEDPTEYDVNLNVSKRPDGRTQLYLRYGTRFMTDDIARHILQIFKETVSSLLKNPNARLVDLLTITEDDVALIRQHNETIPDALEVCLHQLVSERCRVQPESYAIDGWDGVFTYDEIENLSQKLAYHLVSLGVGPEVMVATYFGKSVWAIISMLAILKAGGVVVPLDIQRSSFIVKTMIAQVNSKTILVEDIHHGDHFNDISATVCIVNEDLFDLLPESKLQAACEHVKPHNAAFVIHTSDTGDKPIGVILEHRAISTSLQARGKAFTLDANTRTLQFTPHATGNSIADIFATLMFGGCICVSSEQDYIDTNISEVMERYRVSFAALTPTIATSVHGYHVPSLKTLVFTGETVNKSSLEGLSTHFRLINAYQSIESSFYTTSTDIDLSRDSMNIGHGVAARMWVVEQDNPHKLVPIGVVGELLVEGPLLARGYLQDEERTSTAFITDPSWVHDYGFTTGRRLYRTGDLVQQNLDGSIAFVDRRNEQITVNSQRVNKTDIENRISLIESHVHGAVLGLVSTTKGPKLAAAIQIPHPELYGYNTPADNLLPVTDALTELLNRVQTALSRELPTHMIPELYVPIKHLPIRESGKLDRRTVLQFLESSPDHILLQYMPSAFTNSQPLTKLERQLRLLWAKVLDKEEESIVTGSHFFRLGGDSVAAMRLVSWAQEVHLRITVSNIFQYPILSDMAQYLDHTTRSPQQERKMIIPFSLWRDQHMLSPDEDLSQHISYAATQCHLDETAIEDMYPCTPLQEGLMTISATQSSSYTKQHVFIMDRSLDVGRFKSAWQQIANSMPILRTRIIMDSFSRSSQVVVRSDIQWNDAMDLQKYLSEDIANRMDYGSELLRFGLVKSTSNERIYFIWTAHHSIYDGWTTSKILQSVAQIYFHGYTPQPVPYNEFIQFLQESNKEEEKDYWRSQLAKNNSVGFPETPGPEHEPNPSEKIACDLQLDTNESNITTSTLIRAAWALLISQETQSDDVIFGAPLSGRAAPVSGILDILGPTLTTVPVRINIDRAQPVLEFLSRVQQQATDMIPFEHTGLQYIQRLISDGQPTLDMQRLLQHLLVIQPTARDDNSSEFPGLEAVPVEDEGFFNYPLIVICNVDNDTNSVHVEAQFDKAVVPHTQMSRLLHRFQSIFCQLQECPRVVANYRSRRVGDMVVISSSDVEQLKKWNSPVHKPSQACLHELISKRAQERPASSAIRDWNGTRTYSQIESLSTRLAIHLIELGVQPETIVGISFEKSYLTIISMLAILKAGGCVVALGVNHPTQRIQVILRDTGANIVLTSQQYRHRLEEIASNSRVVTVDTEFLKSLPLQDLHMSNNFSDTHFNNPAFIIYTSGSTGVPKGVVLEHGALSTSMLAHGAVLGIGIDTRTLQFAAYTFDGSIMEIFTTLVHGGCVCVISEDDRMSNLPGAIEAVGANFAVLTPTVAGLFHPEDAPSLTEIVLVGEPIKPSVAVDWARSAKVFNGYGPTECSILSTLKDFSDCPEYNPQSVLFSNIGSVLSGGLWVVDAVNHNRLVPIGVVGELLISGPFLARGYLNDEKKTSASFIDKPVWAVENEIEFSGRMYRTGDLVYQAPDGSFIYVGRKDTQIKINGQRVETGEIEHHLRSHPSISDAIVIYPKEGPYKHRLVALFTAHDFTPDADNETFLPYIDQSHYAEISQVIDDMSETLSLSLATYMMPTAWLPVARLPTNDSGKADRIKIRRFIEVLKSEDDSMITQTSPHELLCTPTTTSEKILQEIWGQVLNLPLHSVPVNRSFLTVGGDSITAMQVVSQCRKRNILLLVRDILQSKSITDFARSVAVPRSMHIGEDDQTGPFPLTPIQRLYFESIAGDKLNVAHDNRYNQSFCLNLRQYIDPLEIDRAVKSLVTSHPMLRARFSPPQSDEWSQTIEESIDGSYKCQLHLVTKDKDMMNLIAHSQSTLDLENGPVFSTDLVAFPDKTQFLFLTAHHLVIDLVSWRLISRDLEQLIQGKQISSNPGISFASWSRFQQRYVPNSVQAGLPVETQSMKWSYWGVDEINNLHENSVEEAIVINESLTSQLFGTCNETMRTEPLDLLLAALVHSFLQCFPGRKAPTIFDEGHGRDVGDDAVDLSETVGWFTSMLPVYVPMEDNQDDILDILRRLKDIRRSIPNKGIPYFLSRFLAPEGRKEFESHRQMEVTFNYTGRYQQLERNDGLFELHSLDSEETSPIGPKTKRMAIFEIIASVFNGQLKLGFSFNRYAKHQRQIQNWISTYSVSLERLVSELSHQTDNIYTLTDYPLAGLNYEDLKMLQEEYLPQIGVKGLDEVEDIYPCSPIQQGILMSQVKSPTTYQIRQVCKLHDGSGSTGTINLSRLQSAWKDVVGRHPILRTIFIDCLSTSNIFDQLVLKTFQPSVEIISCEIGDDFSIRMGELPNLNYEGGRPCHRLSFFYKETGHVYALFDISHALVDASSLSLIVYDLKQAYDQKLTTSSGPRYSAYIAFLQQSSVAEDLNYWKKYPSGAEPCNLPGDFSNSQQKPSAALVKKVESVLEDTNDLARFSEIHGFTVANILQVAWGLLLSAYTGSSKVLFGYLASGRDAPIEHINELVGPMINMMITSMSLNPDSTVLDVVQQVQDNFLEGFQHQRSSLIDIQHALDLSGERLFNSTISYRRDEGQQTSSLGIESTSGEDPTEYDVNLHIGWKGKSAKFTLQYTPSYLTADSATHILRNFEHLVQVIVRNEKTRLMDLELVAPHDLEQIVEWNDNLHFPLSRLVSITWCTRRVDLNQTP